MSHLASFIADLVRDKLSQARAVGEGEVRLIFHGPPLEVLGEVFDILTAPGSERFDVPILIQLPELAAGEANPAVGASGRCDDTHLLNLRNSPSQPTFL